MPCDWPVPNFVRKGAMALDQVGQRRSQRAFMSWEKFTSITNRFFPSIRILHPLPCHRFDARTRGKRSYAGAAGVPYRC